MPGSTSPHTRAVSRKRLWTAAQVAFVGAVFWFAGRALAGQWAGVAERLRGLQPAWGLVWVSAALVLAAYAILIQTWRAMLGAWGARLRFGEAARIWFVSNLGKYVPGKVWQLAAMVVMAQGRGVSPVAATGSTLVVNFANVVSGFAVVFATGATVLSLSARAGPAAGAAIALMLAAGLLALPAAMPVLARWAGRITGRSLAAPRIPPRSVWVATGGTAVAWVLYGVAFHLFAAALLHVPTGATTAYIATYTGSYLIGYLTLLAPGGIGVREAMLVAGLTNLGLLTAPEAWLVAIASRLWLTALEVSPGLLFLLIPGERP